MAPAAGNEASISLTQGQNAGWLAECPASKLFVALDFPDARQALALAEKLAPLGVGFKVGLQLFYAEGMALVQRLQQMQQVDGGKIQAGGHAVFVDLKLHDIPNTVAGAADSLVRQGVGFFNVHAQGGPEMMKAAVEAARRAARESGNPTPKIIAVTLLTSLSEKHLREFLFAEGVSVAEYVEHLAIQARKSGLDGVVCSAQEAPLIRAACGPDFLLVTPGIRPAGSGEQDQSRVITPVDALKNGADYLVVGRPITAAPDPMAATRRILDEMAQAAGQPGS